MIFQDVREDKAKEMINKVRNETRSESYKKYKVLDNGKIRLYAPLVNAFNRANGGSKWRRDDE